MWSQIFKKLIDVLDMNLKFMFNRIQLLIEISMTY